MCQNFLVLKNSLVNRLSFHDADQVEFIQHHPSTRRKLENSRLLLWIAWQPGDEIFVSIIVHADGIIANVWDNKNFFVSSLAWIIELQDHSIILRTVTNQVHWHAAAFIALFRSGKVIVVALCRWLLICGSWVVDLHKFLVARKYNVPVNWEAFLELVYESWVAFLEIFEHSSCSDLVIRLQAEAFQEELWATPCKNIHLVLIS